MKGLVAIPGLDLLQSAYEDFLKGGALAPSELALYSQWTRFDPRLAEIWVQYVGTHWEGTHPLALRAAVLTQPWPNAMAVLLEFVGNGVETAKKPLYRLWQKSVTLGFESASHEQFYIGLRAVGGGEMFRDAALSLAEYRKWGYLSREVPIHGPRRGFHYSRQTRLEILKSLFARQPRVTASEYREALGGCVSERQAERDLEACPWVSARGRTRGRFFVKRPA